VSAPAAMAASMKARLAVTPDTIRRTSDTALDLQTVRPIILEILRPQQHLQAGFDVFAFSAMRCRILPLVPPSPQPSLEPCRDVA
jgi:hypothetical protein